MYKLSLIQITTRRKQQFTHGETGNFFYILPKIAPFWLRFVHNAINFLIFGRTEHKINDTVASIVPPIENATGHVYYKLHPSITEQVNYKYM
jgi:hypothetical protein